MHPLLRQIDFVERCALDLLQEELARRSSEVVERFQRASVADRQRLLADATTSAKLLPADRARIVDMICQSPDPPPPPAMPPVVAGSTRGPVVSQGPVLDLDRLPGWASAVAMRERVMGLVREVPPVRKVFVGAVGLVALASVWGSVPPLMHTVEPSKDGFFYRSFDDGQWRAFPNPHLPQPSVEQTALRDGFIQYGTGSPIPTPAPTPHAEAAPQAAVPAVPKIAASADNPLALSGPVFEPPPPPAPAMSRVEADKMRKLIEQAGRPASPAAPLTNNQMISGFHDPAPASVPAAKAAPKPGADPSVPPEEGQPGSEKWVYPHRFALANGFIMIPYPPFDRPVPKDEFLRHKKENNETLLRPWSIGRYFNPNGNCIYVTDPRVMDDNRCWHWRRPGEEQFVH